MSGGTVTIGAMTTHAEVAASKDVAAGDPGAGRTGRRHRRPPGAQSRHASAAASPTTTRRPDYPAAVLGLGATIHDRPAHDRGRRVLQGPVRDRAAGRRDHHRRSASRCRRRPAGRSSSSRRRASRSSACSSPRRASGVRVAVTGAGAGVFRAKALERQLAADWSAQACDGVKIDAQGLNSDLHGSAEYRAALIPVLARAGRRRLLTPRARVDCRAARRRAAGVALAAMTTLPASIDDAQRLLAHDYVADRALATARVPGAEAAAAAVPRGRARHRQDRDRARRWPRCSSGR